jgi:hypothetical protein
MRDQMNRVANRENDDVKTDATEETEQESKFAGGRPPPVSSTFNEQNGTAQLAFEEDANERELKTKVAALVTSRFGGDYKKAFSHYDTDKDGGVTKSEIVQLLSDAGVGNGLTRGIWATKIIDKLDGNQDRAIQWPEFESVFRATA